MKYRATKLILVLIALPAICYALVGGAEAGLASETTTQRRAQPRAQTRRPDYSKFSHRVDAHAQACVACHKFPTRNWKDVRKGDAAFPDVADYPEHASCVGCHREQFFRGAQPAICTICHTNPSPRDSSRHPFPNPSELFDASKKGASAISEFGIYFPHDKHIDIVGRDSDPRRPAARRAFVTVSYGAGASAEEGEPKSCAVCHQTYQPQNDSDGEFVTKPPKNLPDTAFWLKKGTFKTSPSSHAACFTCHSADSGLTPAPTDCATCHRLLPPGEVLPLAVSRNDFDPKLVAAMGVKDKTTLEKWSHRDTAKFRHEWIPHAGLSCTVCHNVAAMSTLSEATKKVPIRSCGGEGSGCHIEATTDGVLNFEVDKKRAGASFQCTKCHINNGAKRVPDTHISAVSTAKPK